MTPNNNDQDDLDLSVKEQDALFPSETQSEFDLDGDPSLRSQKLHNYDENVVQREMTEFLRNEKSRADKLKGVVHSTIVWAIRIAFCVGIVVLLVRVFHLLTPAYWQWLTAEQIEGLNQFIFGGIIGAVGRKYLDMIVQK